eukprot:5805750-Alexandrium_andersonii.AAC.1
MCIRDRPKRGQDPSNFGNITTAQPMRPNQPILLLSPWAPPEGEMRERLLPPLPRAEPSTGLIPRIPTRLAL